MEAKAIARFLRISPQKARLVVNLVRGMKVEEADRILAFSRKRAAGLVKKVLKSALANATQNPNIDEKILYVKEIFINQGPAMKRHRAKTMGRTAPVKRRMSHITVVLDEQ
jgi:large subunit ribosomal protein L22